MCLMSYLTTDFQYQSLYALSESKWKIYALPVLLLEESGVHGETNTDFQPDTGEIKVVLSVLRY